MEALTALLESLTPAQREVVEKAKGEWARTVAQIKRLEIEVEHQRLLILELRRARYGAKGDRPLPTPPPHDPRPLLHRRSPKANSFQQFV